MESTQKAYVYKIMGSFLYSKYCTYANDSLILSCDKNVYLNIKLYSFKNRKGTCLSSKYRIQRKTCMKVLAKSPLDRKIYKRMWVIRRGQKPYVYFATSVLNIIIF